MALLTKNLVGLLAAAMVSLSGVSCSETGVVDDDGGTVTEPPPPPGVLLSVNWSTATGNSVEAVTDGGKAINPRWCNWPAILSVVAGGPVGWTRTPNVFRVQSITGGCGHVEFENLFPRPTAAEQFWVVRYYVMNGVGQTDSKVHPHTLWPVGAIEAVHTGITPVSGTNGDWWHSTRWGAQDYAFPQGGVGGPLYSWRPMDGNSARVLQAGTWYRYEFIMHWLDADRYRVYPRMYDMAGNLLNDHTTWRHSDGAGTMAEYYGRGEYFTRTGRTTGIDNIRTLSFGMGQSGGSNGYYYVAELAVKLGVSNSDFIGVGTP